MLPQEHMIERVRALCRDDARLQAAMMYGSFSYGEADAFSDIEFLLFFADEVFEQVEPRVWLDQIAPVELLYVNEHGIHAAIFDNLVRGEFHFHRLSDVTILEAWPAAGIAFPALDSILIVDKSGALTPYLEAVIGPQPDRTDPGELQFLANSFINWTLFGFNVLRRGEYVRALEILGIVQRWLLQMARAAEGRTDHWFTPSRLAEHDFSPETYARLRTCTAPLDPRALRLAYRAAWDWGGELLDDLRAHHTITVPDGLRERITAAIHAETESPSS
ncbi:MAG: Lnu(F)/Lnu(G) family lincosamide nucleotidyltransferase [Anaerolineae bacterium]|nr:Lnu(F)/Lnu(G) family lincosamide nucleotidyltransferase [Anaerolineae bacterium]